MLRKMNIKRQLTVVMLLILLFSNLSLAAQLSDNNNVSTNDELLSIPLSRVDITYVDDDNTEGPWDGTLEHPFQFIQDGINAVSPHDTVYVFNGTYYENVKLNKTGAKLIGENKNTTIIDGGNEGTVVIIERYDLKLKGFTIKNSGNDWLFNSDSGIKVEIDYSSKYLIIKNNIISDNSIGIYARPEPHGTGKNDNIQITDNIIKNNKEGIHFKEGTDNIITRNIIINNDKGIILRSSNRIIVQLNQIQNNREKGVKIIGSIFNIVKKNNFINNSENAFFIYIYLNHWNRNYWDDWSGTGIYVIDGVYYYPDDETPVKNFDLHPAKEPYDIPIGETTVEKQQNQYSLKDSQQSSSSLLLKFLEQFQFLDILLERLLY